MTERIGSVWSFRIVWRLQHGIMIVQKEDYASKPVFLLEGAVSDLVVISSLQKLDPLPFDQINHSMLLCDPP